MNKLFRTSKFISALIKLSGGIIVVILGLIIMASGADSGADILLAIPGVVFMIPGIKACRRVIRQSCPSCGREFVYQNDVTWSPIGVTRKDSIVTAHIEFVCTCPACHAVRSFNETVTIGNENDPSPFISDSKLEKLAAKAWKK